MKKILVLLITSLGLYSTSAAQCAVSGVAVQLHSVVISGGGCIANFDLSWEQQVNSGNKYATLHLWRTDLYPALEANLLAYTSTSDHPDETDLANAIATILIENNGSPNPTIGAIYNPHPAVPVLSAGLTVTKENIGANLDRMTVKNITLTIPDCAGTSLTGDVWLSQAADGQGVHCIFSGISVLIGNPKVSGSLYCIVPHEYDVLIKNEGITGIDVTYDIFIDEGDAIYEPTAHDLKITAVPMGPYTIASGDTYNSGKLSYLPYSNTKPYADRGLWVEVTAVGIPNKAIYYIVNPCFALAANYTSFAAVREHKEVKLLWQTAGEVNNYGFEVQRRIGDADFKTVAFIPSKAMNGNSVKALYYNYTDLNATRYITEYRLKQTDLNDEYRLSQVITVRGDDEDAGHVVYPNPAVSNTVKLLFKDWKTFYDIDLVDLSGRVVKKYQNISGERLVMNQIPQGIYILRIIDKTTKEMSSERVIVYN